MPTLSRASLSPTRNSGHIASRLSITVAVAAVLAAQASAGTVTLNNGDTQNYTPVATGASGGVEMRTFSGQAFSDASSINFQGTASSVATSTNLAIPSQPVTTGTQFLGALNVTTAGSYTFASNSDDGSRIFIDGTLLVNNEGGHGVTTLSNTVALDAGRHEIRVEYVNNTSGGSVAVTYSGPDQTTIAAIPAANLFRAENSALVSTTVAPSTVTALGDDIVLNGAAAATINLNGTAYSNAGLNSLNFGAGSTLNVTGTANRDLRFGSTVLNGGSTYTVNTLPDVAFGVTSGAAAGATIVKQGTGRLILDNASATANDFTGATFDVQGGSLYVIGSSVAGSTNPLGTSTVRLNGGTLALDTAVGDVSFNNQITLAGAGGTIQAVPGPRTMTLSNTSAIAIGAAQTLTLNTLSGSNNAAGGVLLLNAPLTGTGALMKTQTSAGNGSQLGNAILAGNSSGFSGAVTVAAGGGILEGRATAATDKPFGTGAITLAGGQLNLRGGSATASTTYALGNDILVTGATTLDANLFTGTAQNSTFALGALTTTGAQTVTMNSANGYNITFSSINLGGNTTFNVNTGTITPGTFTGGAATLTKGGAGTLALAAANSYTGATTINGGILVAPVIADTGGSSIGTGGVTLNGGTLRYSGTAAVVTTRAFNAGNTAANNGIDVSNAAGSLEIASGFAGNTGGSFAKQGAGTLILSGTADNASLILNAQAGLTQLAKSGLATSRAVAGISNIATGATVQLAGSGTDQIYGGSTSGNTAAVTMSGGTLDLNGKSEGFDRLIGSGLVTNNAAAGTTSTLTLGESGGSGTFTGFIKDGANGGKIGLTKVGAGVMTLGASTTTTGSNTYSGATTISGGTLRLQASVTAPVVGSSLWLDAADASSVTLVPNGTSTGVSQWNDKSGNGRNATQTVAANQPGYTSNALVGGKNVVDFGGGGQSMAVDLSFLNNSSYTIFSVEGKQSSGNVYYLGTQTAATNQGLHVGYRDDDTYTLAQYGNDLNYDSAALAYNGTQVFRMWTDSLNTATGGGHAIALNGTQVASNTTLTPLSNAGAGILGRGYAAGTNYVGDLGEILIYNSSLSAADRQAVQAYLNAKWFGIGAYSNILPTNTAVNITASGATLDLNGVNQVVGSLSGVTGSQVTLGSGTLTVGDATNTTFSGVISSTGTPAASFVKQGTGTLTLAGANTYTGGTTVSDGTLIVTGSISGSATTVAGPNAVLAGTGTVGATTLTAGTLTSGNNSIAPLATGSLSLNGGTTRFELSADGSSDRLNTVGTVSIGARVQLSLSFTADLAENTTFTLINNDTAADAITFAGGGGFFLGANSITPGTAFSYTSGGFTESFKLSYTGGDGNDLTITVVPEPSTAMALLGGCGVLALRRRRRGN